MAMQAILTGHCELMVRWRSDPRKKRARSTVGPGTSFLGWPLMSVMHSTSHSERVGVQL